RTASANPPDAETLPRPLRESGPCSKADLVRASGLSAPSVTKFVATLISIGLVDTAGEGASTGGRPAAAGKTAKIRERGEEELSPVGPDFSTWLRIMFVSPPSERFLPPVPALAPHPPRLQSQSVWRPGCFRYIWEVSADTCAARKAP